MLRILLAALLLLPASSAAPPNRVCGGLPYEALAVGGAPSIVSLAFVGNTAYALLDGQPVSHLPQYLALNPVSRACATTLVSDPLISAVSPPRTASVASQTIVGGDFNGDGIPDAASLSVSPNRVSVFLGDSAGALNLKASYVIGPSSASIIAADFNGDGKLDLAVVDSGISCGSDPGSIFVLLGNGDGTFQTPARYAADSGPVSIVATDFNGDGQLDLAVANARSASISILLGVGDGTFQRATQFLVDQGPYSLVAADFNSDGRQDLAISNRLSNTVAILPGNGDGTFQDPISFPVAEGPGFLATGDFNGDGKPDVAVLFDSTNTLSILLGTGGGFLARPVNYVVGASPNSLALADLDGDGVLDILAPDPSSRSVLILWGNLNGMFDAAPLYPVGDGPASVALADFNGDGIADLVTPNQGSSDFSVLLGNRDGTFRVLSRVALSDPSAATRPTAIGVGDFNGDGTPDLAIALGSPLDRVTILLGKGNGTFQTGGNFRTGADPVSVLVADFNGDGKLDLATANSNQTSNSDFGSMTVLLGNGDGTFRAPVTYDAGVRPYAVVAGDFNGDGVPDLAVGAGGDAATQQPSTVAILLGQGDGTFQPAQYSVIAQNRVSSAPAGSLAVGDVNGDGNLDLVVTTSGSVVVLAGAGDGTFQQTTFPISSGASSIALADIDGDGNLDLVIAHSSGDMSYLLGNGDGTFQSETHFPGGGSPAWTAIGDFNGDGKPDLAVADSEQSGSVAILLNRLSR
jgi:hypothetical protein